MILTELNINKPRYDPKWGIWRLKETHEPQQHSLSSLYRVVRRHVKSKVGWDTIIGHLEGLVKERVLVRERKHGSNNETYYRLREFRAMHGRNIPIIMK